ncbi:MAG: hypothetical protein GEU71_02750 [Actinobacteria bacterium]|nr:hypothetical protein [Actinomycetota bacterium]
MKTADELGRRFDHHPPHHPVQVGLFTADSHYDHVGCLVRPCRTCGGHAMADVYAALVESSSEEHSFPVTAKFTSTAAADQPHWFVCAACGCFGALDRQAIDEALTPGFKKVN